MSRKCFGEFGFFLSHDCKIIVCISLQVRVALAGQWQGCGKDSVLNYRKCFNDVQNVTTNLLTGNVPNVVFFWLFCF